MSPRSLFSQLCVMKSNLDNGTNVTIPDLTNQARAKAKYFWILPDKSPACDISLVVMWDIKKTFLQKCLACFLPPLNSFQRGVLVSLIRPQNGQARKYDNILKKLLQYK